jgi:hypothetical protein
MSIASRTQVTQSWYYLALMHQPAMAGGGGEPTAATGENLPWRLCRSGLAANDAPCYLEHCVIVGMATNLSQT